MSSDTRMSPLPALSKALCRREENRHCWDKPSQFWWSEETWDLGGREQPFYLGNGICIKLVNLELYPVLSQTVLQLLLASEFFSWQNTASCLCKGHGTVLILAHRVVEDLEGAFLFSERSGMMAPFCHSFTLMCLAVPGLDCCMGCSLAVALRPRPVAASLVVGHSLQGVRAAVMVPRGLSSPGALAHRLSSWAWA